MKLKPCCDKWELTGVFVCPKSTSKEELAFPNEELIGKPAVRIGLFDDKMYPIRWCPLCFKTLEVEE